MEFDCSIIISPGQCFSSSFSSVSPEAAMGRNKRVLKSGGWAAGTGREVRGREPTRACAWRAQRALLVNPSKACITAGVTNSASLIRGGEADGGARRPPRRPS